MRFIIFSLFVSITTALVDQHLTARIYFSSLTVTSSRIFDDTSPITIRTFGNEDEAHGDGNETAVDFLAADPLQYPSDYPIVIDIFNPAIFERFPNLLYLVMNNVEMTQIGQNSFNNCGKLIHIAFQSNKIEVIDNNVFRHCEYVQWLMLSQNFIHTIRPEAFVGLKSLSLLYLNKNQITELHRGVFKSLDLLHIIWMAENNITRLGADAFGYHPRLENLMFESNGINAIEQGLFDKIPGWFSFDLSGNLCVDQRLTVGSVLIDEVLAECFNNW